MVTIVGIGYDEQNNTTTPPQGLRKADIPYSSENCLFDYSETFFMGIDY
jgi:hypothetical protein